MSGQFSQTNDIDEDVKMVQENGKWLDLQLTGAR